MSAQLCTVDNTALVLIDHQVGTMGWVGAISFDQMKRTQAGAWQAGMLSDLWSRRAEPTESALTLLRPERRAGL
jgi:hypothetical protein